MRDERLTRGIEPLPSQKQLQIDTFSPVFSFADVIYLLGLVLQGRRLFL